MKHVAVGIISRINQQGRTEYLLVSSDKDSFGEFSGAYYPPGGHIEKGESESQALVREIKEELSLDIEVVEKIADTPGDMEDQETHWWKCSIAGGQMQIDGNELSDARFATEDEMRSLRLWPATERFFNEYIFKN